MDEKNTEKMIAQKSIMEREVTENEEHFYTLIIKNNLFTFQTQDCTSPVSSNNILFIDFVCPFISCILLNEIFQTNKNYS